MIAEILILILLLIIAYLLLMFSSKIIGGEPTNPDVDREYARLCTTLEMMKIMPEYEAKNILERWIVGMANVEDLKREDPVFINDTTLDDKFLQECADKSIKDGQERLAQLRTLIGDFLALKTWPPVRPRLINDQFIKANGWIGRFPQYMIHQKRDDIARCVFRYGSIVQGGQQWSIPSKIYDVIRKQAPDAIEGFASPFNRHLQQFCSLFPDVDEPFGSIGTFWQTEFKAGSVVIVNPPFVTSIIDRMVEKCLATKDVTFLIIVPNWQGTDFVKKLEPHNGRVLTPKTYGYESGRKFILASFPTLVAQVGPSGKLDVDKIIQSWTVKT